MKTIVVLLLISLDLNLHGQDLDSASVHRGGQVSVNFGLSAFFTQQDLEDFLVNNGFNGRYCGFSKCKPTPKGYSFPMFLEVQLMQNNTWPILFGLTAGINNTSNIEGYDESYDDPFAFFGSPIEGLLSINTHMEYVNPVVNFREVGISAGPSLNLCSFVYKKGDRKVARRHVKVGASFSVAPVRDFTIGSTSMSMFVKYNWLPRSTARFMVKNTSSGQEAYELSPEEVSMSSLMFGVSIVAW